MIANAELARPPLQAMLSHAREPLAMPIAVYPGAPLIGATVRDIVTSSEAQFAASRALNERLGTPAVLTAMDLSVEAEAFGCALSSSETEVPTVVGQLVTSMQQAKDLPMPGPDSGRAGVFVRAARLLKNLPNRPPVLGGVIGPFSLAARLAGVSEICQMTVTDPELVLVLLEKSTEFLLGYVDLFKEAGASGVIMAEPAAGLLSPRAMARFSSAYIRQIAERLQDNSFQIILHNCAAKLVHVPAILEAGTSALHFGAPMDLPAALRRIPPQIAVCGNLDPAAVFVQSSPEEARTQAADLLRQTAAHQNFVLSSGCDVPPNGSLANLDAICKAAKGR